MNRPVQNLLGAALVVLCLVGLHRMAQAGEAIAPLISYRVEWQARAHADMPLAIPSNHRREGYQAQGQTIVSEVEGEAIVRFVEKEGRLTVRDVHYLAAMARNDVTTSTLAHDPIRGDCLIRNIRSVNEPHAYAGMRVTDRASPLMLFGEPFDPAGSTVLRNALAGLAAMRFSEVSRTQMLGTCGTAPAPGDVTPARAAVEFAPVVLSEAMQRHALDLHADPNDPSRYVAAETFEARAASGVPLEVEWRAEARRIGGCRDGHGNTFADAIAISADRAEIGPDGLATLTLMATCDSTPAPRIDVELMINAEAGSGGHRHYDQRPLGTLNGISLTEALPSVTVKTGADGRATLSFEPPGKTPKSRQFGVAGLYEIKAAIKGRPMRTARIPLSVRFTNLSLFDERSENEAMIRRGGMESHPDGTFGTPGTLRALGALARDVVRTQHAHNAALKACGLPPWEVRKLSVNDIALPGGGLFDWRGNWAPPHQTHGRGEAADINHFFATGTQPDCGGARVWVEAWLMAVLLELGRTHGRWDAFDLALPPRLLHLHVED